LAAAERRGSTALEPAHHLGCEPNYSFGLDLAVDSTGHARRHQQAAPAALYVQLLYGSAFSLPRVPGNYAPAVPFFARGDGREIDACLAGRVGSGRVGSGRVGSKIFHVTVRDARLRGTALIHPEDFSIQAPDQSKTALPLLRDALARGDPPALASAFVPLMVGPVTRRLIGAFGLKLRPQLVPSIEGAAAFWKTPLAKFPELCALLPD
jgi:hypothetical protein